MDKIFSARLDEDIIERIGGLARRLRTSKKQIIENAVQRYSDNIDNEEKFDVFEQTCGAWRRKESAAQTVAAARKAFRKSMEKHQK